MTGFVGITGSDVAQTFPGLSSWKLFEIELGYGWRQAPSKLGLGETLTDRFLNALYLLRAKQAPLNAPTHAVEELKPVLQRRVLQLLPLIETSLADVEEPAISNVVSVHLEAFAFLRGAGPTDLGFGHGNVVRGVKDSDRAAGRLRSP
jgi:hypothetical protein